MHGEVINKISRHNCDSAQFRKIYLIDGNSELAGVSISEYNLKKTELELSRIYKEEDIKWLQRSKEKEMFQGDSLTTYGES